MGKLGEPAVMYNPAISPDGLRVATDITDEKANNVDIWFLSTTDRGGTRFTFDPQEETNAVWSHDGKPVTYRSNLLVGTGLLVQPATGLVPLKTLVKYAGTDDIIPNSWSRDDSQILSTHSTPSGDYLALPSPAGGAPVRFHKGTGSENNRDDFAGRKMGGLCVRRIGKLGDLRHHVPERRGKVTGFTRRRHATTLA